MSKGKRVGLLIAMACTAVIAFGLGYFVANWFRTDKDCVQNEEVNPKNSYVTYNMVGYDVEGDGVLFETEDVTLTIGKIYKTDEDDYKIEYIVENRSKYPMRLGFAVVGINGYARDVFDYNYDKYAPKSVTTIYRPIYNIEDFKIKTMDFTSFSVYCEKTGSYSGYRDNKVTHITTDTEYLFEPVAQEGTEVYNDYGIRMTVIKDSEWGPYVQVENNTDYNINVSANDCYVGDELYICFGMSGACIPAHTILIPNFAVYPVTNDKHDRFEFDSLSVSFEIQCKDNPQMDFKTPYVKVR